MSNIEPVRYAVVGYGLAGSTFHAPLIDVCDGAELTAVVVRNEEAATAVRERYPLVTSVSDIGELPDLGVEVAVIATPNDTHAPLATQAMELGMAAVVDKPLATTSEEGQSLLDTAARHGVLLTCYQNRRWDGDFLTVRKLRDDGQLGTIHRFESRFERWRPEIKAGWKESPSAGAGVLFDLGPHIIDQAIQLMGPVTSVYTEVNAVREGAQVSDDAFVALTHESGAESHLWASLTAAAPGPRFRVLGSRAAFVKYGLDPQEDALRAGRVPLDFGWGAEVRHKWGELWAGESHQKFMTVNGDYLQFYRLLTDAVRSNGEPPVNPQDSLDVLRIIEQASNA